MLYSVTFITCPCCRVHSHQKQRKKKSRPSLLLMCRRRLQPVSRSQTLNFFPPAPTRQLGGHWLKISKGKGQRGRDREKASTLPLAANKNLLKADSCKEDSVESGKGITSGRPVFAKPVLSCFPPFRPSPSPGK